MHVIVILTLVVIIVVAGYFSTKLQLRTDPNLLYLRRLGEKILTMYFTEHDHGTTNAIAEHLEQPPTDVEAALQLLLRDLRLSLTVTTPGSSTEWCLPSK